MSERKQTPRILTASDEAALLREAEECFQLQPEQLERVDFSSEGEGVTALFCPVDLWPTYSNMSATFFLDYEPDGVYLELLPPQGTGASLNRSRLFDYVRRKNVAGLQESVLRGLSIKGYGRSIIAPPQKEYVLNEELRITIAPDEISASGVLLPGDPDGTELTMADLERALQEKQITFGIDRSALECVLREKPYFEATVIAKGTSAQNGEDGTLTFHFKTTHTGTPKLDEATGRVDFWNLDLIERIEEGDLLVSRTLATPGISGTTVCGKTLTPRFGKETRMPRGQKVRYNEDKTQMYAMVTGQVEFRNGIVVVSNVYEVSGDVDLTVGNIDFDGAVIVHGNVTTHMSIRAKGDVTVYGGVQDATIEAGGDVTIRNGLQGKGTGVVIAGGDLKAKFIEQGKVRVHGNVETDEIVHSEVDSGHDVFVLGKPGSIVGGTVRAYHMVAAQSVGAVSHPRTRVEVGIDPQTSQRCRTLETLIADHRRKIEKLQRLCDYLLAKQGQDEDSLERMRQAFATKVNCMQATLTMEKELGGLQKNLEGAENTMVHVLDIAYPDSVLQLSNFSYVVSGTPIRHATFKLSGEDQEVVFFPCCFSEKDHRPRHSD